jgi:SAM-dependent methyltransferase
MGQTQQSVESFGWQWSEQVVVDSTRTFYRRLFQDSKIWFDHLDGKTVADVGSGNGRHTWALARLTRAKKLFSVELAKDAVRVQRQYLTDPRIEIIEGDAAEATFKADVIFMLGFIQHAADPLAVLRRQLDNLNDGGELIVSFYMRTPTTMALEPVRTVTKRLPRSVLWAISPVLILPFIVRKVSREHGLKNARHTAYDWFGSHAYQKYFTEAEIDSLLGASGVHAGNVLKLAKGHYRVRKGAFGPELSDELHSFGRTA